VLDLAGLEARDLDAAAAEIAARVEAFAAA
jgi:hypothetical protein